MSARASALCPSKLLRRHVLKRAGDHAFLRQCVSLLGKRRYFRLHLGQSEIQQLHAGFCDQDIARFEVAVYDPLAVRRVERVGNLAGQMERFADRKPARWLMAHG